MSEGSGDGRPLQVTWGAALAVVCGVLVVVTAFDALAGLHSVETRQRLARALGTGEARSLGVSVADATQVMHGLLLVGGGAAAVAAVLAGYAFRRHPGARAGLAVAAMVAMVGSFAAAPVFGLLLVVGSGMLWSAPARRWFHPDRAPSASASSRSPEDAGVEPPTPPERLPPPVSPVAPQADAQTGRSGPPPPTYGYGTAAPELREEAGVQPAYSARRRPAAPGAVKAAVTLTWTCCALALVGLFAAAAVLANDRPRVEEVLRQQPGYDRFAGHEDALIAGLWFVDGALALWTLAAAVIALFVLRGHEWARVLLLVSAGAAAMLALVAFPASIFHVVGSGVVFGLLLSRSAVAWCRHRGVVLADHRGPGPGPEHDQQPPSDRPPHVW